MAETPRLLVVTGMQTEAAVAAGPGILTLCSGARPALLQQQLAALAPEAIAAVVSFGVAGGLDPALRPGALVLAAAVNGESAGPASVQLAAATEKRFAAIGIPVHPGAVLGMEAPALTLADKRRLRQQTGAALIDMESHIAAEWAAAHGLPFMVLRVIADPAGRTLPRAAMATIGPDGAVHAAPALLSLLKRPAELPALVATARDSAAAFRTLRRCRPVLAGLLGGFLGAHLR